MTNAPETRKTHVIRILGTNKAGDVLPDMWADVERIDQAKNVLGNGDESTWQGMVRKLRWCDDPQSNEYEPDGNPARKETIVKVCDPSEENLDDPEEWIPISAIKHFKSVSSHGNYQGQMERLLNDDLTEARKVENRRIVHYDTNIDSDAQAAFDADPTLKVFVASGDQYARDDSTKDADQYIEHEIVTYLKQRGNSVDKNNAGEQGRQVKLLNQYLIDESEDAQLIEQGSNGINPPYRLDPYQTIVNVQLSSRVYVIITCAKNDYAMANKEGVKVLEKKQGPGPQSQFMTGTLIECSTSAGEDFAKLNSTMVGGPGGEGGGEGSTLIATMVYPKTEEVRKNWWSYARKYQGLDLVGPTGDRLHEIGPFLWISVFRAYNPCTVKFKIRNKPHLKGTPPTSTIVEAYPTTGSHTGAGGQSEPISVSGFWITSYRTDKKGEKIIFTGINLVSPPEWKIDYVGIDAGTPFEPKGLRFGKDPPLIGVDIEDDSFFTL